VPWLLRMTIVVSFLMAPAALYLLWRLYVSGPRVISQLKRRKFILPAIICSFYLFPLVGVVDFYLTCDIDVLKYPKPLTYWFWFGLIFVFQLVTWVIIADLIKWASRFFSGNKAWIGSVHSRALVTLFVIIFCYTGWKVYKDTTRIVVEDITLNIEDLPGSLHGFKIVHISDIQGDEYTGSQRIADYIGKLNAQNPDLVIFTGDLISYGTDFIKQSAREFGQAESKYGVYAVVGDHDYWAGTGHVEEALKEAGIPLLQDENAVIPIDRSYSAVITGITEVYSKQSDPEIADSLARSAGEGALKIFASHQVDDYLISSAREHDFDMMLAGHTHGGQIRVPFMGMEFSASERETSYISGLYFDGHLPIIVNNGLGFTLGPIRYNAPPTITVIELQPE